MMPNAYIEYCADQARIYAGHELTRWLKNGLDDVHRWAQERDADNGKPIVSRSI